MGRFQLELIYLYFPPGTTVENKGKLILNIKTNTSQVNINSYDCEQIEMKAYSGAAKVSISQFRIYTLIM